VERPALLGGGLHLLARSHVASLASGCADRLRNAVREKNHVTTLANKQKGGGGGSASPWHQSVMAEGGRASLMTGNETCTYCEPKATRPHSRAEVPRRCEATVSR